MPILHMETDSVRNTGQQLQQVADSLNQQTQQLNQSVQNLSIAWLGSSSNVFTSEIQTLLNTFSKLVNAGATLNQRLQREVDEWERIDSIFGDSALGQAAIIGAVATVTAGTSNVIGDIISGDVDGNAPYESDYDVDKQEFRLNPDELIDFRPGYAGDELGDVMKELNAFIAENYEDGMSADNPELIQKMADALNIDYQEAEHQYSQLFAIMAESEQDGINDLSGVFEMKGHWGSRRQLLFGKVVGDSLGLHPAFAALLSPSGGLIGPGDGAVALGLDGNLSGVIDENAWDYHGATHDAAGYLYNNYEVGEGYEYVDEGMLSILNNDSLDSSNPLSGQLSGYVFWAKELGISYKEVVDLAIKGSLPPGASMIF